MPTTKGFVREAQGKRNAVERYIISNCPDYTKNKRGEAKKEAMKKEPHLSDSVSLRLTSEPQRWLG